MWAGEWQVRRFEEIDSTNSYLLERARQGDPEGWWRWPTTRRPGADASIGAGSRRRAPTCWPRCSSAPTATPTTCTCARVPWASPRWMPAPRWPGSSRSSNGPTTCWWATAKLAGVLAEAEFLRRPSPAVVVGHRAQRRLARSPGRRGHLPRRLSERPSPIDRIDSARAPAGRSGRPPAPARRGRRPPAVGRRGPGPLRHPRPGGPGRSCPRRSSRGGPSPSTTPAGCWSRRVSGQRAVTAGDVMHVRAL